MKTPLEQQLELLAKLAEALAFEAEPAHYVAALEDAAP